MYDAAGQPIRIGDTVGGTTSGRYQGTIVGPLTKLGKGQVKVEVQHTTRPYDIKVGEEKWISADRVFLVRSSVPAAPAEPTAEQQHARRIILSAAEEASDWGGIGEQLDDEYERLGQEEGDRLRERVADLIDKATVTVSWQADTPEADR